MDTFGYKLKSVREEKGFTLESASDAIGITVEGLRALESNAFETLPDEDAVVAVLRDYAVYLGVDADLMVEDYRSELARECRPSEASTPAQTPDDVVRARGESRATAEPELVVDPPPPTPRAPSSEANKNVHRSLWPVALVVVVVVAFVVLWVRQAPSRTRVSKTFTPATSESTKALEAVAMPTGAGAPAAADVVEAMSRAPQPPPDPTAFEERTGATIGEYGVGTGVADRRLVGEGESFREGTQVWFWTRVDGGSVGERVQHVWLHDGVEAARVELRIGGSNWRTHSAKTLWPGSVGEWVVEARGETGRLLARDSFTCLP